MMFGQCNACNAIALSRVEVRTDTQRLVLCGGCALKVSESGVPCRIVAYVLPAISQFVASDGFYSPRVCDVSAHQRGVDRAAVKYAERVRTTIARKKAVNGYTRLLADLRASAVPATVGEPATR